MPLIIDRAGYERRRAALLARLFALRQGAIIVPTIPKPLEPDSPPGKAFLAGLRRGWLEQLCELRAAYYGSGKAA